MDSTPTTVSPPITVAQQQPNTVVHGHTHGTVGPVIGVLAVIAVLGFVAGVVGRLCSGRSIMGYGGDFDGESWVEAKCSSCVDGYVGPPPPRAPPQTVAPVTESGGAGNRTPVVGRFPARNTGESKTEQVEEQRESERELSEEQQREQEREREREGEREREEGYNENHEHIHS